MEICRNFKLFFFFLFFFSTNLLAENNKLKDTLVNIPINAEDLVLLKYDVFLLKNAKRIIGTGDLGIRSMVAYQNAFFKVVMNNEKLNIYISAIMDKKRYKYKKRYYPKISDCNVVRNKLFLNKHGYGFFTQKRNLYVDSDMLKKVLENNFYNISGLDKKTKEKLVENTYIFIEVIHPNPSKNIECKGKFVDDELY